jgi:hypothetical protein
MTDLPIAKRSATVEEVDRRSRRRFVIQQGLRYRLLYGSRIAETSTGRVINISSSGVRFTTEDRLGTGTPVELAIAWPARVNDICPMKLMVYGCVVRSDEQSAVLSIERYEFRTQGTTSLPLYNEVTIRLPN